MDALLLLTTLCITAGPPDWVESAGKSARYPEKSFLTGFSVSPKLETAKAEAAADLAKRVRVKVEQTSSSVSAEANGRERYEVAVMTRATTDLELADVAYETYEKNFQQYVLAYLSREKLTKQYKDRRDEAIQKAEACVESGRKLAKTESARALQTLASCRGPVTLAFGSEAIVRAVDNTAALDEARQKALIALDLAIDEELGGLKRGAATTLEDAIETIAMELEEQGTLAGGRYSIAPLTYGTTPFSSPFGRQFAKDVESALARRAGKQKAQGDRVLTGAYSERDASRLILNVTIRDAGTSRLLGGAKAELPMKAVPAELRIKPENMETALQDQKLLAAGEQVGGDLRVEVWTNKGDRNLVFEQGDEMRLFFRVNQPAYVSLFYLLASGAKVPLEQAYYVDASKVNMAVEYPEKFEVTAPFGVEQLFVVAHLQKPVPVQTRKTVLDGEEYEVVDSDNMVKHRGVKAKKKDDQVAEGSLSITTMKKL